MIQLFFLTTVTVFIEAATSFSEDVRGPVGWLQCGRSLLRDIKARMSVHLVRITQRHSMPTTSNANARTNHDGLLTIPVHSVESSRIPKCKEVIRRRSVERGSVGASLCDDIFEAEDYDTKIRICLMQCVTMPNSHNRAFSQP